MKEMKAKNKIRGFFGLFVTLALAVGVGVNLASREAAKTEAASTTVTVTRDDFTGSVGYSLGTWSKGAISGEGVIYFTTTTNIQVSTTPGRQPYPYNLVATPGAITGISVTMPGTGTLRSLTPRMNATAAVTEPTGGTALTAQTFTSNTQTLSWTIPASNNYKFFHLVPGGNTNWANFSVTYEESTQEFGILDHISLDTTNAKLSYYVGDTFTLSGLAVTAYDTVEFSKILSSGYTSDYDDVIFDTEDIGTKTVTVSYMEGEITKTAAYDIEIEEAPILQAFTKVSNLSQLHVGSEYIIAGTKEEVVWVMSTIQGTNNRTAIEANMSGATVLESETTQIFVLEEGTITDTFSFKAVNGDTAGQYIYAASSESNYLKSKETKDDNGSWAIGIADAVTSATAQGTNTRNQLKFNSSSALFSAYGSGQIDIDIYVDLDSIPEETPYDEAKVFADWMMDVSRDSEVCEDKFLEAWEMWDALSLEARDSFAAEADFAPAHARFLNWAIANGFSTLEELEFGSAKTTVNFNNNSLTVIVVIGVLGLTTLAGYYFLKKKKEAK